jgi:hypothetical protein
LINKKKFKQISTHCIVLLLIIGISNNSIPTTYAEDPKAIRNKAIYDAEWAFAQTTVKARDEHNKIISDPNVSNEEKTKATAIKNKAIANAKIVKDKAIADAWAAYNNAIAAKELKEKNKQSQKFCFLWWCW